MEPVALVDAGPLKEAADRRVVLLRQAIAAMGIPAEVVHIGSTAHGAGLTKGDVDALVRVDGELFDGARAAFTDRFAVAQRENWTEDFASFTDEGEAGPVGIQAVRSGSPVDVRMRRQHALLSREKVRTAYDRVKSQAAPEGPDAYWKAKDAFWTWLGSTTS